MKEVGHKPRFTCSRCGQTFDEDNSDEERDAETFQLYGVANASKDPECVKICDPCFNILQCLVTLDEVGVDDSLIHSFVSALNKAEEETAHYEEGERVLDELVEKINARIVEPERKIKREGVTIDSMYDLCKLAGVL